MGTLNSWDVTDANNNAAPPDGWPENTMNYSDVNNTGRAVQGTMKRYFSDINGTLDAGGAADAYTLTLNETGYTAYFDGMTFACTIPATNLTTTPTIDVNGIGAQTITDAGGNAITAGSLMAGCTHDFRYDGTNFRLVGMGGVSGLDTQFQFNDGGAFAGSPGMTYDTGSDEVSVANPLNLTADIVFTEQADHASTPGASFGYLWVRDDNPTVLVFTNSNGIDTLLGTTGSTPPGGANGNVQYNDGGNLGGNAAFSFDEAATSGPIVAINEVASATSAQVLQLLINDASGIGEMLQISQDDAANEATLLQLSQSGTSGFSLEINHTGAESAISAFSDNTVEPMVVFEMDGNQAVVDIRGGGNGAAIDLSQRTSNPGIQFPSPAVVVTDSKTLDDYEELDYTTDWNPGGGGSSGTITLNAGVDTCGVIKIGRFVFMQGFIQVGSVSSPVGDLRMDIPYNTSALLSNFANNGYGSCRFIGTWGFSTAEYGHISVGSNDSYVTIERLNDGSIANFAAAGAGLSFSLCYITDE